MPRSITLGALLAALSSAPNAAAAPPAAVETPAPSVLWLATQLVPSPALAFGDGRAGLDLRWQLTPLLVSWGVDRRVSRWRAFVVDPFARHVGSVEAFVAPEVLVSDPAVAFVRAGGRFYAPVLEHGETLSISLGASYQRVSSIDAAAFEAGVYVLFGVIGLQASFAPGPATRAQTIVALSVRYF